MSALDPNWEQTFILHHRWDPAYDTLRLAPGGYLLAIGVRHADDSRDSIRCHDRHIVYRASFGLLRESYTVNDSPIAVLHWEYVYNQCGQGFKEPIPDVNNANSLLLKRLEPARTDAILVVTTVHLGIK